MTGILDDLAGGGVMVIVAGRVVDEKRFETVTDTSAEPSEDGEETDVVEVVERVFIADEISVAPLPTRERLTATVAPQAVAEPLIIEIADVPVAALAPTPELVLVAAAEPGVTVVELPSAEGWTVLTIDAGRKPAISQLWPLRTGWPEDWQRHTEPLAVFRNASGAGGYIVHWREHTPDTALIELQCQLEDQDLLAQVAA